MTGTFPRANQKLFSLFFALSIPIGERPTAQRPVRVRGSGKSSENLQALAKKESGKIFFFRVIRVLLSCLARQTVR